MGGTTATRLRAAAARENILMEGRAKGCDLCGVWVSMNRDKKHLALCVGHARREATASVVLRTRQHPPQPPTRASRGACAGAGWSGLGDVYGVAEQAKKEHVQGQGQGLERGWGLGLGLGTGMMMFWAWLKKQATS